MSDRDPTAWSARTDPVGGHRVLADLADLQRHLDALGSDLVAADRVLDGWQGRARDHFRAGLAAELTGLARLQDDLHAVGASIGDILGDVPDGIDVADP